MKRIWLWVPFGIFVALFGIFAAGLIKPSDHAVPSAMVGKPAPAMNLPGAFVVTEAVDAAFLKNGKPKLVNVFASWCVPCVAEIPVLVEMKAQGVEISGIAVHDTPAALQKFLSDNGNPYSRIGMDIDSHAQIALGSAGVPETFVVDGKGMIRHQHIGVVTPDDVPKLIAKLRGAQ